MFLIASSFAGGNVEKMTTEQVFKVMNDKNVQIIDVNPVEVFNKEHVPTAKHVEFSKVAENLPADKNTKLIFYCKNLKCAASQNAAEVALKNGYTNVAKMPDGIDGWIKNNHPVASTKVAK